MSRFAINFEEKIQSLHRPWSPVELVRVNDHVVRLAIFEGEYPKGFHAHGYDELFFVYRGEIVIQRRGQSDLWLREGELGVIPRGIEHCPKSEGKSTVLMFEPQG